jgi:hypothetical protein
MSDFEQFECDGITTEFDEQIAAAAERAAAEAPEVRPGDDIALGLQRLFAGFPGFVAERHKEAPDTAA